MGASVRYIDTNENVSKIRSRENAMRPGTGFAALFRDGPLLFLDAPGAGATGPCYPSYENCLTHCRSRWEVSINSSSRDESNR